MSNTIEQTRQSLGSKLDKLTLTPAEIAEGIRECFLLCQYQFAAQDMPDYLIEKVQRQIDDQIALTFRELGVSSDQPSLDALRHAITLLNKRIDFAQDEKILALNQDIIRQLLNKRVSHPDRLH